MLEFLISTDPNSTLDSSPTETPLSVQPSKLNFFINNQTDESLF